MTHLRIEQTTGSIEEISSSVITKLYEIVHAGLDESSNLQGRLHSPVGIRRQIQELTTTYPNLYINVDDYVIEFEDPKVVTYLNSIGVGSNGIVTEAQAAAATVAANSQNTEITKFNELRYFTNITTSKGGWTQTGQSGSIRFREWTALEEIDISNITALGHWGNNYDDTFYGCTSLKKVTTNGNLAKIGYNAFYGCSNLEQITGLSGDIQVAGNAFVNCTKLPQSTIQNCTFSFVGASNENGSNSALKNTKFTQVNLSAGVDFIPAGFCQENDQLQSITGGTITTVRSFAFYYCSKLTSFDFSNVEAIEGAAFDHCDITGTLSIPNLKTLSGDYIFSNNTHLSAVNIDWSNLTNSGPTGNMFRSCTALSTIDLTGAKAIGNGAFQGCSNLTTVTGLSDCKTINGSAFQDCNHLTTIDLSNVEIIGQQAFYNCSSLSGDLVLTNINGPSNNTIENGSFYNTGYSTITLSSNYLVSIYQGSGSGKVLPISHCQNLTKINLEGCSALTKFGGATDCPNLKTVILPSHCNTFNYNAFQNSNQLESLVLQYDGVATLPTGNGQQYFISSSLGKIYVPDTYVSDYKTTYPYFASRIYGISELPS